MSSQPFDTPIVIEKRPVGGVQATFRIPLDKPLADPSNDNRPLFDGRETVWMMASLFMTGMFVGAGVMFVCGWRVWLACVMPERPLTPPGYMLLTNAEYRRLLIAAESDDTLIWCEACGAWLDHEDPACANVEDVNGCWKYVGGREKDSHLCRSHRAPDRKPTADDLKPNADLVMPVTSTS